MKKAATITRYLLGVIFFVFGLNGFLNFIPAPPPEGVPGQLMAAFAATGYFMYVVKAVEVVSGILLLANRFVPLALLFLAPVVVQITLFHVFLAPATGAVGYLVTVGVFFLGYAYRGVFRPALSARAEPGE